VKPNEWDTRLADFAPIQLAQMNNVALLNRVEDKFLLRTDTLAQVLTELTEFYAVLEVRNYRISRYRTLYFDTKEYALYRSHHAGLRNRYKVRSRAYLESQDGGWLRSSGMSRRILALETSGRTGSVAAMQADRLLGQIVLPPEQRSSASLAPTIGRLLDEVGWQSPDVDLVAVTRGPGSFTGVRIGVTTAKAFAYAAGAEILGIDTLAVIAAQSASVTSDNTDPSTAADPCEIDCILDAQRGQLFAATFCCGRNAGSAGMETIRPAAVVDVDTWLAALLADRTVSGPGLARILPRLPQHVKVTPREVWQPMAEWVGRLAWQDWQTGRRDDVWQITPVYLRPSAAEEKRRERGEE
jgi:tRNA threonylcarbamoyladenosine biosynthesis protein TsaB